MGKRVLAIDIGASNGRAMLGEFDGGKVSVEELHRFENNPVMLGGVFYWDFLNLYREMTRGIQKAFVGGGADTVGIDTWAVDFGLLDARGHLLQNPVHYRDKRTAGLIPEVCGRIGRERLYQATGNQFLELNTLFQLYALKQQQPELLERADSALLFPDLLGYYLTGQRTAEFTVASTTQMLNPHTAQWNADILEELGIPLLFPEARMPGGELGPLSAAVQEELGVGRMRVVSVAGHDTASAVVAAPATADSFIYISCGTWSLFGTELPAPHISEKSLAYNITNEGGYGGTTRFLKNIIGLWLIQETRRQYAREGAQYSYNDLEQHALKAEPFRYLIDPDSPEFGLPGDIPTRIRNWCKRTGQGEPASVGEVMRCIYESLALKHRYTFDQIRDCTGQDYRHIHMIGGGTKDGLLCQMTADATGCDIVAGPVEATALGNIMVQLIAQGEVADLAEARQVIAGSFQPVIYRPGAGEWAEAYGAFRNLIETGRVPAKERC